MVRFGLDIRQARRCAGTRLTLYATTTPVSRHDVLHPWPNLNLNPSQAEWHEVKSTASSSWCHVSPHKLHACGCKLRAPSCSAQAQAPECHVCTRACLPRLWPSTSVDTWTQLDAAGLDAAWSRSTFRWPRCLPPPPQHRCWQQDQTCRCRPPHPLLRLILLLLIIIILISVRVREGRGGRAGSGSGSGLG